MKNLAIIPARGGSKRIPRKNIKNFLGKPIIAYTIEAAFESNLFDEVMVSTDDEEISEIARGFGVKIPFMRSSANSDDYSSIADVEQEVLNYYLGQNKMFDNSCIIFPAAPLITSQLLRDSYSMFVQEGFDNLRPIVKFQSSIQRAFRVRENRVELREEEYRYTRTQDLESFYYDAGMFYWSKTATGLKGQNRGGFIIQEWQSQDIDDASHWKLAELKYKLMNN